MKYLPLREFENVTSAINFDTADCHVIGACDLYTTKAAGTDKKLYKAIETSLESQHESLVRLSESLSPPNAELFSLNLSRPSPFGPLSESRSRRTFAYLIATLNASHPDYDFSNILRASDFRKERSLRRVMNIIDDTLYNLRPRPAGALLAIPTGWKSTTALGGAQTPGGSQTWGPKMWRAIDKEMALRECEIYCYSPDEDPFDGEENALWSVNYLFFNRIKKRVCYFYLRGLSISSHSPGTPASIGGKRARAISGALNPDFGSLGSGKRAKYWLGDGSDNPMIGSWDEDNDMNHFALTHPGDDEVDIEDSPFGSEPSSCGFSDSEEDIEIERRFLAKSAVRRMSEHIADSVEV